MSAEEKISKSLKSAVTHFEQSMAALSKKDDNAFSASVWRTAAELEYALFLFSLMFQDEGDTSKWKLKPQIKKLETNQILNAAQSFLNDADQDMASKKLSEAYKNAYTARNYILKVQEDLVKKRRQALKKK